MARSFIQRLGCFVGLVAAARASPRQAAEQARLTPISPPQYEVESDEPAIKSGLPGPAAPEDQLWNEEFDALVVGRWREIAGGGAPASDPPRVTMVAEAAGERGLALVSSEVRGIETTLEVKRRDALLVTARVRSFANATPACLRARDLSVAAQDGEVEAAAAGDDAGAAAEVIPTTRDLADVRLLVEESPYNSSRKIRIRIVAGDGVLVLDRVSVRALRPVERAWLVARDAHAARLPAARLRVNLPSMDVEMLGVFVPVGGSVRWRGRVPERAPRLELATCVVGGDRGGGLEWSLEIDGVAIARRKESVGSDPRYSPFSPWSVALAAFAGREVTLSLRCSGNRDVLGFAGAPRLVGAAPAGAPPNVVIVSLDTLRADRAGPRPDGTTLTPRLDRFAASGARFTRACSTSSWTLPAHASIFTGQHPLVHGVVDFDTAIDPARSQVLAARFRDAGYATAAFTAGGLVDPHFGFARGFDLYSVRDPCGMSQETMTKWFSYLPKRPTCEEVGASTRPLFDWVRRHADGRFFLFLHTYKVHEYDDPSATTPELQRTLMVQRAIEGDLAVLAELKRRYDQAVRETDEQFVGGLLDLLDELKLRERTLVVVLSDHGEEFCEQGRFGHAGAITNELGSIVLAMAGPGVPAAQRVDKRVSLVDVSGTIARLAGLAPDPDWRGIDLFAPAPEEPRAVVLDLARKPRRVEALWMGTWQVTRDFGDDADHPFVSFCRVDPETNVAAAVEPSPSQREAMVRRLDHEIERRRGHAQQLPGHNRAMSEELRDRLRQLGYLGR